MRNRTPTRRGMNNLAFDGIAGQQSFYSTNTSATFTAANGNLQGVDPQFVNYLSGDFTLRSTSPAIGAGTTVYGVAAQDLAGNPRTTSGKVDIGAYEYSASTAPATPTSALILNLPATITCRRCNQRPNFFAEQWSGNANRQCVHLRHAEWRLAAAVGVGLRGNSAGNSVCGGQRGGDGLRHIRPGRRLHPQRVVCRGYELRRRRLSQLQRGSSSGGSAPGELLCLRRSFFLDCRFWTKRDGAGINHAAEWLQLRRLLLLHRIAGERIVQLLSVNRDTGRRHGHHDADGFSVFFCQRPPPQLFSVVQTRRSPQGLVVPSSRTTTKYGRFSTPAT
jgi:hypothetical protein